MRFVWSHAVLRTLALCSFVLSIVQTCLSSYLVTFLNHDLRWTLVAAGFALAAAQVGGVVGRVLWGVIADWRGEARNVLIALVVAMGGCGLAMPWLTPSMPHAPVIALMMVFGATAIGWNGVYLATIARVVPVHQATAATSGSLFFTYFGVVVGPTLFGTVGASMGSLGSPFAWLALPLGWVLWRLSSWRSAQ
jgi:predicted MFS family arabinose efflux permease